MGNAIRIEVPASAASPNAGQELRERLRAILPALRARAGGEESLRRLSDETIADLRESGVLHMHVPAFYGGAELGLRDHFEAARVLASGALSTAWVASFLAQGAIWGRKFSPEVQRRLFNDPNYTGICGSNQAHAGSKATKVDGGYLLTGRWGFNSGILHATWTTLSVPYDPGDGAAPTRLFCVVRAADVRIDDVWHTAGMRATGSNDVVLDNLFIPNDQALDASVFGTARSPGEIADPTNELIKYPIFRVATLAHTAYTLGAAERCLEYFANEIVPKRQRYWGGGALKDSTTIYLRYAYAVRDVRVAALLAEDVVSGTIEGQRKGYTMEQRAHLTLASASSINVAGDAVRALARQSGGSMHFTGHEMDRILRDVSVLLNHSTGDIDYAAESVGRVLLGQGLGKRAEVFF